MMNKDEIFNKEFSSIAERSYNELLLLARGKGAVTKEFKDSEGKYYQIDVRVRYEDEATGELRVTGSLYKVREAKWWHIFKIETPIKTKVFFASAPKA